MTDCFCGCGMAVPRFPFGIRTINKRGTLVSQRLAWARAYGDDEELFRPEFLKDGAQLVALFRTTVHQDLDPEVDDEYVSEWLNYVPVDYLVLRRKAELDLLEGNSSAWMRLGRDLERLGIQHGRTLPINRWLAEAGDAR